MHILACAPPSSVLLTKYSSHISLSKDRPFAPTILSNCCHPYVFPPFHCTPWEGKTNLRSGEREEFAVKTCGTTRYFAVYCLCQHRPRECQDFIVSVIRLHSSASTVIFNFLSIYIYIKKKSLKWVANLFRSATGYSHTIILLVFSTMQPYHATC